MTNGERTAKIAHYEWMLETMNLRPQHVLWITKLLNDLRQEVTA